MKYTQEDITEGCLRKEREYQKALYEEYASEMFALCLRYMENREEAEDILQDTFLKVFSKPESFRNVRNLRAWLRQVFVNNILNVLKARKIFVPLDEETVYGTDDKEVFDAKPSEYSIKDLLSALKILKKEERIVFNMNELENISFKEMEKILNKKSSTLRSISRRAKIKMSNYLKEMEKKNYE
ncbi:MAG: RNA polymerase sigma factor [Bacteroidales bacterium]|nr:RNA polymerase sigma factor [Bacteroidales bacterium]